MSDDEGYKTRDPRLKKRESLEPAPPGKLLKKEMLASIYVAFEGCTRIVKHELLKI